jgi:NAD(P)H-hydrate epimerase
MTTMLLDCAAMACVDRAAQEVYGLPAGILMENAARSAAEFIIKELFPEGESGSVLVAAGKGNNGGDALAAARHLYNAGFVNIQVLLLRKDLGELPALHLEVLRRLGVPVFFYSDDEEKAKALLSSSAWILDGLFGIGLSGPLAGEAARCVDAINTSPARVISFDVPSGLGDGFRLGFPVVRADVTVTFEAAKLCLYLPLGRLAAGRVVTLSAGFPAEAFPGEFMYGLLGGEAVLRELLPRPRAADYKNTRGHLAVFAGHPGTGGAALLAGEAALRSGAGLVSVFADEDVYAVLACGRRSLMVKPVSADMEPALWEGGSFRAVLAGPGWGRLSSRRAWLGRFLSLGKGGVLDADALYVYAGAYAEGVLPAELSGWVLTPHAGEFSVLCGHAKEEFLANPLPFMKEFCRLHGCVVVLKGHVTIIHDGERAVFYDGMNPALGTAGSGDVLAGIIAGLMCRGLGPWEAALAGVSLHGACGRLAREEAGFFTAEELLPYISREAWRNVEEI